MKRRVRYVDIFRSVGIICMIMGHTSMCPVEFARWFTCFYMPMYFWISGYFFHCESIGGFVKHKAKTLLVPYYVVGLFSLIIFWIFGTVPQGVGMDEYVKAFLINSWSDYFPISGALWFLAALFWAEIFFAILKKCNSEIVLLLGSIILGIVGTMMHRYTGVRLPWNMDSAFVGEAFMYIGYLCSKYKDNVVVKKIFNMPWYLTVLLFVFNYFTASFNSLSMWKNFYYNIPLFWFNAMLGIIVCFNTAKGIDRCKNKGIQTLASVLNYIGRYSIIYLCMNKLVLWVEKIIMVAAYGGWPTEEDQNLMFAILVISAIIVMSGMAAVYYKCKRELLNRWKA